MPPSQIEEWAAPRRASSRPLTSATTRSARYAQPGHPRQRHDHDLRRARSIRRSQSGQPYTPPGGSPVTPTESWTYDAERQPAHPHRRPRRDDLGGVRQAGPHRRGDRTAGRVGCGRGAAGSLYDDVGQRRRRQVDTMGAWTFFAYDDLDRIWATTRDRTHADRRPSPPTPTTTTPVTSPGCCGPSNVSTGASSDRRLQRGRRTRRGTRRGGPPHHLHLRPGRTARDVDRPVGPVDPVHLRPGGPPGRRSTVLAGGRPTALDVDGVRRGGQPSLVRPTRWAWTTTATYDALGQLADVRGAGRRVDVDHDVVRVREGRAADAADRRAGQRDGLHVQQPRTCVEAVIEPSTAAHPEFADREWTVSYDAGGLPVTEVAPGGVTRTRTFDELGRLTARDRRRAAASGRRPARWATTWRGG